MAEAPAVKTKTTGEILGESVARDLLQDIFADLHPALLDGNPRPVEHFFNCAIGWGVFVPTDQFRDAAQRHRQLREFVKEVSGPDRRGGKDPRRVARPGVPGDSADRAELSASFVCSLSKRQGSRRQSAQAASSLYVLNADAKAMKDVFSMNVAAWLRISFVQTQRQFQFPRRYLQPGGARILSAAGSREV